MVKTTKTLKLTFLNSKKKKTSITLGDAMDNLTAEQVRGAMTTIAEANVFEKVLHITQLLNLLRTLNVLLATSLTMGILMQQNLQTSKTNLELLFEVIDLLKSKLGKSEVTH